MSINLSQTRLSFKKTPKLDSKSRAELGTVNLNLRTPIPGPSGMSRKLSKHQARPKVENNPAKQSALRFKEQIFGRKF